VRLNFRLVSVLVISLLILMMLGMLYCNRESADSLYRDAQQHVRDGELDAAVALYKKIIADYADTPTAERARKEMGLYRDLARIEQNFPVRQAKDRLIEAGRAVLLYHNTHRRWPERLADLVPEFLETEPVDPWGRQLVYMRKKQADDGFLLVMLGSDGASGGAGEAIDLFIEDGALVESPSVRWP
jgi:hypothetical protein